MGFLNLPETTEARGQQSPLELKSQSGWASRMGAHDRTGGFFKVH